MMKKFQDAGFRVAETPVHHYHRAHGKSQFFNFRRIFRTAIDVFKLWWALVIRRESREASVVHERDTAPRSYRGRELRRPGNPSGDRGFLSRPVE
jgi:hypothetical protein